jgi:hypothetical protein
VTTEPIPVRVVTAGDEDVVVDELWEQRSAGVRAHGWIPVREIEPARIVQQRRVDRCIREEHGLPTRRRAGTHVPG